MLFLPYLGIVFAATSLPVLATMMKGRIVRLIPLSLVAAVIYGWLSAVTKMTPFNLMYIGSAAGMAFVVYLIFAFLLDRFDETLAIWFGIYLAALVVFLCIR